MEMSNNNTPENKSMSPWSLLFAVFLGVFYFLISFALTIGPAVFSTYLFRKMDKKLIEYGISKAEKKYADLYSVICQASLYLIGSLTFLRIITGDDGIKGAATVPERLGNKDYWGMYIVVVSFIVLPCLFLYSMRIIKLFRSISPAGEVKEEESDNDLLREANELLRKKKLQQEETDRKIREQEEILESIRREESRRQSKAPQDPFEILGVPRTATSTEIKKAYYKVVAQYHPDKVASLGPEFKTMAEEKSKIINRAYEECLKKSA